MIDKVSRLAERVAAGVSRRGFLSWVGRGAMSLAVLVGGVAAKKPPPPPPRILNGSCCGLNSPWYDPARGLCCTTATGSDCYGCSHSTYCNGGGTCRGITGQVYSDNFCRTLCA